MNTQGILRITLYALFCVTLIPTSCSNKTEANKHSYVKNRSDKKTYVCIGASAAGLSCAQTLCKLVPDDNVICYSAEVERPYDKCKLHKYLSNPQNANPTIFEGDSKKYRNLDLQCGVTVTDIDTNNKILKLANGKAQSYDKLFIGTGSSPIIPNIKGIKEAANAFIYYDYHSVQSLSNYINTLKSKNIVVLGAGLRALECADALNKRGLHVTVVCRSEHVLGEKADSQGSTLIKQYMATSKINCVSNATLESVTINNNKITSIQLSNKENLLCDILVIAYGTTPNNQLALQAKLDLINDGIKVDATMATSNPNIYAGGDIAVVKDQTTGQCVRSSKWREAEIQGKIAAHNMVGNKKEYEGIFNINISSFFGLKVLTCGNVKNISSTDVAVKRSGKDYSHTFIVRNDVLLAFCLVWDKKTQSQPDPFYLKKLVVEKKQIDSSILTSGSTIYFGIASLPGMISEMSK